MVLCGVSVHSYGFRVLLLKENMQKLEVLSRASAGKHFSTLGKRCLFTLYLQQSSQFTGICSTSHTWRNTEFNKVA